MSNKKFPLGPLGTSRKVTTFTCDYSVSFDVLRLMWIAQLVLCLLAVRFLAAHECINSNKMPDSTLDVEQIFHLQEKLAIYAGSPSILYVPETKEYLVTSDRFGDGFAGEPRNTSIHRKSLLQAQIAGTERVADEATVPWKMDAIWVKDQYWSTLFRLKRSNSTNTNAGKHSNNENTSIYLFGTSTDGPAPIKIAKSTDYGRTWKEENSVVLFGTCMCMIVIVIVIVSLSIRER